MLLLKDPIIDLQKFSYNALFYYKRPQTKTVCCCSMGKAWGLNCDRCPAHGSSDYKSMCGSGPPGVMVNPMTNQTEEIDECQLMPGTIRKYLPIL